MISAQALRCTVGVKTLFTHKLLPLDFHSGVSRRNYSDLAFNSDPWDGVHSAQFS